MRKYLTVCKCCLMGIESHEGQQITRTLWTDENENTCEWCGESGFDELFEIIGRADEF